MILTESYTPPSLENMKPDPETPSAIDPPGDFFRARLVCTILDTCGQFYDRGSLRTKLDVFLLYFQRYLLSKGTLNNDTEFMVQDTIEVGFEKLQQRQEELKKNEK